MKPFAVQTNDLSRNFGALRAVDCVSFSIPSGRVVALLGPNGAGKTTLISMLLGLLEPTGGSARVLGAEPRAMPADVAARIAATGDLLTPPSWARLREMLDLQQSASPHFDRAYAESFCRGRGMNLSSRFGSLSKGQKRWVLAGLALASGADLLLLDEPADGLDPAARRELYDQVRDTVTLRGATALVATHVIGDVERVADDVIIIRDGQVALHESLEDLRDRVREIEMPGLDAMPDMGPGITTLGVRVEGSGLVAHIRCEEGAPAGWEGPRGCAAIRTVGLEPLYQLIAGAKRPTLLRERQGQWAE